MCIICMSHRNLDAPKSVEARKAKSSARKIAPSHDLQIIRELKNQYKISRRGSHIPDPLCQNPHAIYHRVPSKISFLLVIVPFRCNCWQVPRNHIHEISRYGYVQHLQDITVGDRSRARYSFQRLFKERCMPLIYAFFMRGFSDAPS